MPWKPSSGTANTCQHCFASATAASQVAGSAAEDASGIAASDVRRTYGEILIQACSGLGAEG